MSIADTPTPKPMAGTWTLTAPDGRTWQSSSPIGCCSAELDERVPPAVAIARIMREAAQPDDCTRLDKLPRIFHSLRLTAAGKWHLTYDTHTEYQDVRGVIDAAREMP